MDIARILTNFQLRESEWENSQAFKDHDSLHGDIAAIIHQIDCNNILESFDFEDGRLVLTIEDRHGESMTLSVDPNILFGNTGAEIKTHDHEIDMKLKMLRIEHSQAHSAAYLKLKSAMNKFREVQQLKAFEKTEFQAPELPVFYYETSQLIASLEIQIENMKLEKWLRWMSR
jgi:hypothetical protein